LVTSAASYPFDPFYLQYHLAIAAHKVKHGRYLAGSTWIEGNEMVVVIEAS
jgi:hypothetical protein